VDGTAVAVLQSLLSYKNRLTGYAVVFPKHLHERLLPGDVVQGAAAIVGHRLSIANWGTATNRFVHRFVHQC
jgi:hypothetical protein